MKVWKSGVIFSGFQGPTEMGLILKVPQEEGGQKGWRRLPGEETKGAGRGNEVGGCSWRLQTPGPGSKSTGVWLAFIFSSCFSAFAGDPGFERA